MLHSVDAQGRYDGKTLDELWPAVVDEVVQAVDPVEVVLFGSLARGEGGPDSDIDLLVVLDHIAPGDKRQMMARIRSAITTFAPVDVIVTDPQELARRGDDAGSILYWPVREGRHVYRRARTRAPATSPKGCGQGLSTMTPVEPITIDSAPVAPA